MSTSQSCTSGSNLDGDIDVCIWLNVYLVTVGVLFAETYCDDSEISAHADMEEKESKGKVIK